MPLVRLTWLRAFFQATSDRTHSELQLALDDAGAAWIVLRRANHDGARAISGRSPYGQLGEPSFAAHATDSKAANRVSSSVVSNARGQASTNAVTCAPSEGCKVALGHGSQHGPSGLHGVAGAGHGGNARARPESSFGHPPDEVVHNPDRPPYFEAPPSSL